MNIVQSTAQSFSPGDSSGNPGLVETIELKDSAGTVLATFQKTADGTFSLDVQGTISTTSGVLSAAPMAFIDDPTDAASTQQAVIDIIAGLIAADLMEAS